MQLLQIIGQHAEDPPAPHDLVLLLEQADERGLEVPLGDTLKAVVVVLPLADVHVRALQTIEESPFFPGLFRSRCRIWYLRLLSRSRSS